MFPLGIVVGILLLFGGLFGGVANSGAEVSFREVVPVAQREVVWATLGVGLSPSSGVNRFGSETSLICWCHFVVVKGAVTCHVEVVEWEVSILIVDPEGDRSIRVKCYTFRFFDNVWEYF